MSATVQNLLDAMDGVAMVLDHELRITQIGKHNWQRFVDDNEPQDATIRSLSKQGMFDIPVTQFFAGEPVRALFADLFHSVLNGTRPFVKFDFRCDAPSLRRDMRLSVSPITIGGDQRQLLYQSVLLSVEQRPAIPLFAAPVARHDADDILTLCSICACVSWPIGAPAGEQQWIEPSEYYRRGGDDVALISHGICSDCFTRLQDEDW